MSKPNILILVRRFDKLYPKHKVKYEFLQAIEKVANVSYHHEDGDILQILQRQRQRPDFILHYDITAKNRLSPNIENLNRINIPIGAYVIDAHWNNQERRRYFKENDISLIFSVSKRPFLKRFPDFKSKLRFLPFSINQEIIRNWNLEKDTNFLLMGHIAESYPFRQAVRDQMQHVEGFVYHKHPGHLLKDRSKYIIDEEFAKEINRAKMFLTCGSIYKYPVMKYFEVPGCNTLLIGETNGDLGELGFKDGVNFVAANRSNFYEKALYYLNHPEERQALTLAGYKFIHKNHTHQIRAQQFIRYVKEII